MKQQKLERRRENRVNFHALGSRGRLKSLFERSILPWFCIMVIAVSVLPIAASAGTGGDIVAQKAKDYAENYSFDYKSVGKCSGFVDKVYKDCGYSLSAGSQTLINNKSYGSTWVQVEKEDLMPGDVICWVGQHVCIYIGNNKCVNCSDYGGGKTDVHIEILNGTTSSTMTGNTLGANYRCYRYTGFAPTAPTITDVTALGGTVTVAWNSVDGATSYDVYLVQSPWGWGDIRYTQSCSAAADSCTFTNVAEGSYAAFLISRPNDNSAQSDWVSFGVGSAPAAPVITDVSTAGNSVTVNWNRVDGATSYDIYLIQSPWEVKDIRYTQSCSAVADSCTFTNVADGDYAVFMISRPNDDSVKSDWVSFGVGSAPAAPVITDVSTAGNSVTVNWNRVDGAVSYDIYLIQSPWEVKDIRYTQSCSAAADNCTFTDVAEGHYAVFMISRPNEDSVKSDWVSFDVSPAPAEPIRCTVSFDASGGSVFPADKSITAGENYGSLPLPVRDGYIFLGWGASRNSTVFYSETSIVTNPEDHTLFAVWEKQETTPAQVHFERRTVYHQDQFEDVKANQWYTGCVADVFACGLMNGKSAEHFDPYGDVTIAEAITIASRIHSIYTTGTENFVQAAPWYKCYLDYAYENGIISYAYFNSDVSQKATRAQFAEILANSLPREALPEINMVEDNAIPDVRISEYYAPHVYRLYRAGILMGSDVLGTFNPQTYITRAECAAIVSRMIESDNRVTFSLN